MGSVVSRSKNDVYIVMRRGALRTIIGAACSAVVLALAGGLALGHLGSPALRGRREPLKSSTVRAAASPYTAPEIARLQAANASLDARAERLAAQLDTLNTFDQRLRAQTSRSTAGSAAAAKSARQSYSNAEGGPELPPRPCHTASARPDPQVTRDELDCLATTLATLEHGVAQHEAAWDAFPGRRPIESARTSSPFGNRLDPFTGYLSFHPGIDLVAPTGTPILAAASGRVIYAGPMPGYGNTVEIDHGNGFITRYGHASKIEVRVGQRVEPGQAIATVGSTGRSTGPHLHFEIRAGGQPLNPADYLALFARASNA
ncbi:peptidase M23B [Caballeronia temeraria]|uniref:Peptidase M23B n=1 Tax=Caballeronia temeraria TaxID=1777137 RepID=A0A158ACG8_9BURK|nr:M23 family metallopeptidase [Caballeronia temeraria]SAK55276.1 peptidase M23B [Caballeronia temeraria]